MYSQSVIIACCVVICILFQERFAVNVFVTQGFIADVFNANAFNVNVAIANSLCQCVHCGCVYHVRNVYCICVVQMCLL